MPEQASEARAEGLDADAIKRQERNREKDELLHDICILKSRTESLEELIEDKRARLELLMGGDGERARVIAEGGAKFGERRAVKVIDPAEVAKKFPKQVLAEHFSPPVAFLEACDAEGKDYTGALIMGKSPSFEVARAKTKAAKALHEKMVEQTKREAEETLAKIRKTLREAKGD